MEVDVVELDGAAGPSASGRKGSDHVAAAKTMAIMPGMSHARQRRENGTNHSIALIDQFPLRLASTLNLLRAHIRWRARAFRNTADLLGQMSAIERAPCGIVMSVGRQSAIKAPLCEELRDLRGALASTPVIILSDRDQPEEIVAAFEKGVRGYVPTNLEPQLVVDAIRMVLAGGTFVPAEAIMRLHRKVQAASRQDSCPQLDVPVAHRDGNPGHWPPRQLAVLNLLIQAKPNKEIAHVLAMEESTVKVHVRHIMRKLGALNRTQAALCARRLGFSDEGARSLPESTGRDVRFQSALAPSN
jgi:DNA-binding NarL/FixJ family response regulator